MHEGGCGADASALPHPAGGTVLLTGTPDYNAALLYYYTVNLDFRPLVVVSSPLLLLDFVDFVLSNLPSRFFRIFFLMQN